MVDLLGGDKAADQTAERERKAQAAYAAGVLDNMISREDLMDDEDHLLATDLLYAETWLPRFEERDHRNSPNVYAADRDWHLPAHRCRRGQELSEMDWRVRCALPAPILHGGRRSGPTPVGGWSDIVGTRCEPYVPGRGSTVAVVNYRTPAEIMTVRRRAARRLRAGGPATGVGPCLRRPAMVQRSRWTNAHCHRGIVRDEAARVGTSIVIGPPGAGRSAGVETKG